MTENERQLIQQFYDWEVRGRGWLRYDRCVALEPPFRPFAFRFPKARSRSAGQVPTLFSGLTHAVGGLFRGTKHAVSESEVSEPDPAYLDHPAGELIEVQASLPPTCTVTAEVSANLLRSFSGCRGPVALEYVASGGQVIVQWAGDECDAALIQNRNESWLPEAVFVPGSDRLRDVFAPMNSIGIAELGLDLEFLVPLAEVGDLDPDPLVSLIGILGQAAAHEAAVYQVLFEPVHAPWPESMRACVGTPEGEPLFVDAQQLVAQVDAKVASPLFAVVIRLAVGADNEARCRSRLRELTEALQFTHGPGTNRLVALRQREDEDADDLFAEIIERRTRRSGMILNLGELVSLAHLPGESVRVPQLVRQVRKTKAVPAEHRHGTLVLGDNEHAGSVSQVTVSEEDRVRHMHVLGASGTGKSNLLLHCIEQDLRNGQGIAVLDPHGDLVDRIIGLIPEDRWDDVILFDPSDEEYPVGFNILSAKSDLERTLLASDLCAVFRRQSTSWGDQMTTVLSNAILAFLESPTGGTLADLRRFLLENDFRKAFLKTVKDPEVIYFWERNFPQVSGKPQASIVTRLDAFLRPKAVRYMVCQKETALDFGEIMDTGKIFLAKLPQGLIGQENAHLFGTLLVAKFQQTAIARQAIAAERRRNFWLYIDECHHFVTPSMGDILTGSRKYRMGLILAHQELRQLLNRDTEVGSAVLANPATRICFRLGEDDARKMAEGFSFFDTSDLVNLSVGEAIGRVGRSDHDFNLRVPPSTEVDEEVFAHGLGVVRESTRRRYAKPRDEVAADYLRANAWAGESEPNEKRVVRSVPKTDSVDSPSGSGGGEPENPANHPDDSSLKAGPVEPDAVLKPSVGAAPDAEAPPVQSAPILETPVVPPTEAPATQTPAEELPKLAEILAESPAENAPPSEKPAPSEPRPLGRGGLEHQYLQRYLKEVGERFGFRATIEKTIEGGSVDVLWEAEGKTVALEISITTGAEHEAQNLEKCLAAGFHQVIAIGNDARKLARLRKAIETRLAPEQLERISFHTLESLVESLTGRPPKAKSGKKKIKGYDVHTVAPSGDSATGNANQVIHDAVAKALIRLKNRGKEGGES